ncbi:SDR family NAD(P)-dependent oxidoreductase, partial [Diaphorobacter nitroreducens]
AALEGAAVELAAAGAPVLAGRVDVSSAAQMEQLAQDVVQHFGAPLLVFNNAGVGSGGLVWENSARDWEWLLGVNLMGVVHGVRLGVGGENKKKKKKTTQKKKKKTKKNNNKKKKKKKKKKKNKTTKKQKKTKTKKTKKKNPPPPPKNPPHPPTPHPPHPTTHKQNLT